MLRSFRASAIPARCLHSRPILPPLLDDLHSRGLVAQVTSPGLAEAAAYEPLTVYLGVDPTARSLHAGNLLALMGLLHFHIRGHPVIALIGGATGFIGDPCGRNSERPLLSPETLATNAAGLTSQAHAFFSNALRYAEKHFELSNVLPEPKVLNNIDWFRGMGLLDFLRHTGKHAKVNVMIGRESVKHRLQTEQGISFTEFSYQLLQAYDFQTLFQNYNCRVQLGGSDQWGNIVSGIELIRRCHDSLPSQTSSLEEKDSGREVFGLTLPLLTTSSGAKFGKSAGNAVWLDKDLTSYFDLYQFFIRVPDGEVCRYLRMFTLLSLREISAVVSKHQEQPERRLAQRVLASEVVELVHGDIAVRQAEAATEVLFGSHLGTLNLPSATDVIQALKSDPRLKMLSREEILGQPLTKLAAQFGLTRSRGDARKMLVAGGLYLNNERISEERLLNEGDLKDNRISVFRSGKGNHIILVVDE